MAKSKVKRFFFSRTGKLISLVWLFCAVLVTLFWLQVFSQLQNEEERTINAAIQRNANLAVSLEQYAIRTIRNADAALQLVKMKYEEQGRHINFEDLFNRGVIDVNFFNGVAIIDERGLLLANNLNVSDSREMNFSDRDYFNFHQHHTDALHISQPLHSRTINKAVIVLSRRINKPDGSFGGMVAVQVEPSTFTLFYADANLRKHDIISLVAPNGITYARRTGNQESHSEDISKSPLFGHVAVNPVNNYKANDAIRGIPTYFSYRKLQQYPVIATVGSSEKDILADYLVQKNRDYVYGTIVSLLLILFSILICTFFIDRKKYVRKIKTSEASYRSIFENSSEAIIIMSAEGVLEAMNEAGYRLFRISNSSTMCPAAGIYQSSNPQIKLTPEDLANFDQNRPEVNFHRLDGTSFIGEMVYSTYKDVNSNNKYIILIRDISLRKQMEKRLLTEQKRYQRKLTKQIILAQEREREVIGYELHDNVNQVLTTVKLYLEMANHHTELRDELLPKSIAHLKKCIDEIRHLSHELSAPTLGTQSLTDSIKALIEMVETSGKLKIYFQHDRYHTELVKDQRLAIYRILQEQLNNILKHAAATEVSILLSQSGDITAVTIRDNGRGFNIEEKKSGIGFTNMLSRTKVFGGDMVIESAAGKGCAIHISIPIMAAENALNKVDA